MSVYLNSSEKLQINLDNTIYCINVPKPIAALYNTIKLPLLPKNLEMQYMFILRNFNKYILITSECPIKIVNLNDSNAYQYTQSKVKVQSWENNTTEWIGNSITTTTDNPSLLSINKELIWTNFNIMDADNTLYLSASMPQLIYE